MTTSDDDHVPEGDENPLGAIFRAMKVKRENYEKGVLNSRSFQDALRYLEALAPICWRPSPIFACKERGIPPQKIISCSASPRISARP